MNDFVESEVVHPSRRNLLVAAAWAVPVVATVTASPAFADSGAPKAKAAAGVAPPDSIKLSWDSFSASQAGVSKGSADADGEINGSLGLKLTTPGQSATVTVVLFLRNADGELLDKITLGPYSIAPTLDPVNYAFRSLKTGARYYVSGTATGTLTRWVDSDSHQTYSGAWALQPSPVGAVTVDIIGNAGDGAVTAKSPASASPTSSPSPIETPTPTPTSTNP